MAEKGYIYTMFSGADPGKGWTMSDPIFGRVPTLGACVPNVRRLVTQGDYIFAISGRVAGVSQYVVGGFRVAEKIDALAAYERFPENRLCRLPNGQLAGNIIVDQNGQHHPADYHANFEARLQNYIIGTEPISLETEDEIERGRRETVPVLSAVLGRGGATVSQVMGRWARLDSGQIRDLASWLRAIKVP